MNEAPATLDAIAGLIAAAARQGAELLVLPECAYPAYLLGSVDSYRSGDHLSTEGFVRWLSERAAATRLHLICGFIEDTGDRLYNAAILLGPDGREIGRTRKRFLWHLDRDWFSPGDELRAFDTALGRIGIAICAEARVPEIIATLVADGARLIALPTCWINAARQPGEFYNPQVDFLIEARAREFGVPFVCADKAGLEMTMGYVGQSCIVRADGSLAAQANATDETVIVADLAPSRPKGVWMGEHRRSRLLNAARSLVPVDPTSRPLKVAAVSTAYAEPLLTGAMGEPLFEPLQREGVQVLVLNIAHEAVAERLAMLARAFDIHAVGFPTRTDVWKLGPLVVGCQGGQWIDSFAGARAMAMDGVEALVYFDAEMPARLPMLRARALENRVYVLAAGHQSACIISPDGAVLARADGAGPAVVSIDPADAASKWVAPRTDIFAERRVHLYHF